MLNCKKCGKVFEPQKGLKQYCSLECRNSRAWSEEDRLKKSVAATESVKVKKAASSRKGRKLGEYKKVRVEWSCPVCKKVLLLQKKQVEKRKYCSGQCRNKVNNKIYTGVVSKAEKFLVQELKKNFPALEIKQNDRGVLNGLELDVYLPSLSLGIEWNGVYHYKRVHNDSSFERIVESDKSKLRLCKEKGIELVVVKDLTSTKKFIEEQTALIVKYISGRMARQQSPKLYE